MTDSETVELPTQASPPAAEPERRRSGLWRELSGALAVGLAVLAGVVLVFQILAWVRGMPGPGPVTVVGHLVAAGVAVVGQRFADRLRGRAAAACVLGVVAVSLATLWIFWWA